MDIFEPSVSIVILNWNGWKDTIECLESLFQINYKKYHIVLVDNGSKDDSVKIIKQYLNGDIKVKSKFFQYQTSNKPLNFTEITKLDSERKQIKVINLEIKITILKNDKNYGFTEGNNIGIRFALKAYTPDYILLLNNDTVVEKDFLSKLVNFSQLNGSDILQPKIKYYEDLTLNSTGIKLDFFGFTSCRGDHEIDRCQYDTFIREHFFYASGACLLLKKKFLKYMGDEYFDKKLFAYHEDVDICWQARLFGFKIEYCPNSICYHKGSQSTGGRKSAGEANFKKAYWEWRNRIRVLIKNYSWKYLIIALPTTIILEFLSSIFVSINKKEFRYFLTFCKCLIWNIKNFNDTVKLRKIIQQKRVVNDSYISTFIDLKSFELSILKKKFSNFFQGH